MNKRHNKRKKNKKRNQHQNKHHKKSSKKAPKKKQSTDQTQLQRKNNNVSVSMQGFVSVDMRHMPGMATDKLSKLWCVLIGNIMYFYRQNKNKIPFTAVNLSRRAKVEVIDLYHSDNSFLGFGIRLFDEYGNESEYVYSDVKHRQKWFKLISDRIGTNTIKNDEKKSDHRINILTANGLVQNNDTFVLCDISLLKNIDNQFEIFFKDRTINLSNYETVAICSGGDSKNKTLFKYGITFKCNSDKIADFSFLMKYNNDRMEFFCHLHEIINEQSLTIINIYGGIKSEQIQTGHGDYKQDPDNDKQTENMRNQSNSEQTRDKIIQTCGNCSKKDVPSRCGGCKLVYYCNKQCQSKHWKKHKKKCKLLRRNNRMNKNRVNSKFVISLDEMDDNKSHGMTDSFEITNSGDFCFGEEFVYSESYIHSSTYVIAKYDTLKVELLKNPYFRITNEKYLEYFIEAYRLKHSSHFKNIKVKCMASENLLWGIAEGSNITINHIICLLSYCNNDIN